MKRYLQEYQKVHLWILILWYNFPHHVIRVSLIVKIKHWKVISLKNWLKTLLLNILSYSFYKSVLLVFSVRMIASWCMCLWQLCFLLWCKKCFCLQSSSVYSGPSDFFGLASFLIKNPRMHKASHSLAGHMGTPTRSLSQIWC